MVVNHCSDIEQDALTKRLEGAIIGFVEDNPDTGIIYNIESILGIFIDAGYSRDGAKKLFESKVRYVDSTSVFLWPN